MMLRCRENKIYASADFDYYWINVKHILSIEPYYDQCIIRISSGLSYIADYDIHKLVDMLRYA